jgi:predicted small secreted protein
MEKYLERELINYLYFDLNRLRYFIGDEIFEYDIQSSIHQFLKQKLKNKNLFVQREKQGWVDIVIQTRDVKGKPIPQTLIEVKSFIKSRKKINYSKICDDIRKLSKKNFENVEGYFLLAIKESHFNNRKSNQLLSTFITTLRSKKKNYNFIIDGHSVNTRIIRSLKTSYEKGDAKDKVHKAQVRLFIFQLK